VAFAASAGGLNALTAVLGGLPDDFPAPVLIVQHVDPRHKSLMAEILDRRTPLQVKEAEEGDKIRAGSIYVAPPNKHMLVAPGGVISLTTSELVNFVRPSADLLFESVAASYRDRAIAVVLSGSGSDGASGVRAIKQTGGTTIAQDKQSSEHFGMPGSAIETGDVDFVLPLDDIASAIKTLMGGGSKA
jgi:two-component system chemotaxis response regulator CheB